MLEAPSRCEALAVLGQADEFDLEMLLKSGLCADRIVLAAAPRGGTKQRALKGALASPDGTSGPVAAGADPAR